MAALQIEEAAVFEALNHLYEQQFIYNASQGGFYLNEDLEEMMTAISQAPAYSIFPAGKPYINSLVSRFKIQNLGIRNMSLLPAVLKGKKFFFISLIPFQ